MIEPGRYSAWFKTPVRKGSGVVKFGTSGKLTGGDDTFVYDGRWSQEGERLRASLSTKRVVAGPPRMFGLDEIDIVVTGRKWPS